MIRMAGVDKHFGELHVLRDINLEVDSGQVVVVLGPSGSGQVHALPDHQPPGADRQRDHRGRRQALPEEGKALAALRADVGMVFQSFNLFAHKTILENVTLAPIKVRKTRRPRPRRTGWRCWSGSASPTSGTSTRPSSPAASSSARPSPARWP